MQFVKFEYIGELKLLARLVIYTVSRVWMTHSSLKNTFLNSVG